MVIPIDGLNYYRLKVVNQNGEIDFSTIIGLLLNPENQIQIFPNPVSDLLNLKFNNPDILPTTFTLQIFDASGKLVKHLEQKKANLVSIPIKGLPIWQLFSSSNNGIWFF